LSLDWHLGRPSAVRLGLRTSGKGIRTRGYFTFLGLTQACGCEVLSKELPAHRRRPVAGYQRPSGNGRLEVVRARAERADHLGRWITPRQVLPDVHCTVSASGLQAWPVTQTQAQHTSGRDQAPHLASAAKGRRPMGVAAKNRHPRSLPDRIDQKTSKSCDVPLVSNVLSRLKMLTESVSLNGSGISSSNVVWIQTSELPPVGT